MDGKEEKRRGIGCDGGIEVALIRKVCLPQLPYFVEVNNTWTGVHCTVSIEVLFEVYY